MQQDFGSLIYVALPSTRLRTSPGFFRSKYTVPSSQEYEIQFARIGCPVSQSVYRRYRQFHHLYRDLQDIEELQDTKFPQKHALNSLKTEIVGRRKVELEEWLRKAAGLQLCHRRVYEFLNIAGSLPLEAVQPSFAENFITETLHRLISEPHMKLTTLEYFDKRFFPRAGSLQSDFILVFLHFLLPILSDDHAGAQALGVLHSLISRKKFKGAVEVIRTIPLLTKEDIKKARLETHLLERYFRGTRENACEVFKVVYEECVAQGRDLVLELVLPTQLNRNSEALTVFDTWYSAQLAEEHSIHISTNATPWQRKTSPNGDVQIQYRAIGKVVESEVFLTINASLERIIQVILQPELRCLWDLRVTKCEFKPIEGNKSFKLTVELENCGVVQEVEGVMRVEREEDRAVVYYEANMGIVSTSYEIKTCRRSAYPDCLSSHSLPTFTDADTEQSSTPSFTPFDPVSDPEQDQCSVTVRNYGAEAIAKRFIPDLLGEENMFMSTWMKFKSVAEGDVPMPPPDDPSISLDSVVARKTLPSCRKRSVTDTKDSQSPSTRKLERRMFITQCL